MDKQLTAKQEHFAQCVADGMTQADAYRTAYDVSANTLPETIWAEASRLMADHMVSARVKELREDLAEKALWTREDSVRELREAVGMAKDEKQITALTGAIKELNAMHGYNEPTKHNINGNLDVHLVRRIIVDKDDS